MTPEHDTQIVERAATYFRSHYKSKANMQALLASYTNRLQEVEDLLWSMLIGMLLDNAVGVNLDIIGKLVGQTRISSDDELYRRAIKARVRINISQGQPEDLYYVIRVMVPGSTFTYLDVYPAQIIIEIDDSMSTNDPNLLAIFLWATRAAGVGLRLWYNVSGDNTFAFSGGDDWDTIVEDDDQGWGYDAAPSIGGYWATSTNPQPPYIFLPPFVPSGFDSGFDDGFGGP